ncbi:MAG: RnfH family protein [Marinicellaceae bacterium]
MFTVELIYALLSEQKLIKLEVQEGSSISDVIKQSKILQDYPEINLSVNKVGIYNQVKHLDEIVKAGDRIEIYRNLIANPKQVRIQRAQKQRDQGIIK